MKFAVIGLGSFGWNVAKTLYEGGEDVLAVDREKARVRVEHVSMIKRQTRPNPTPSPSPCRR